MRSRSALVGISLAGLLLVSSALSAPVPETGKTNRTSRADDFFASTNIVRIRLEIPAAGIAALRRTSWGHGNERPVVRITVREGNTIYTNVTAHLKGAAGSFRPVDQNPGFTLNFDKVATGQSFHGIQKLSLNNSVQDPSFMTEKICRELFEAAGVPVPRATHAKVELNGRDLGLYVLTEGFNQQFLKRYFKNTKGNLYDGGFVKEITDSLAVNSGDAPRDHSGLNALIGAASDPDPARRWQRLERALDTDRFISFIAMEVILCHWDGYALNRNNWRIYHDLDSNRMVFFPHGMDQMFGAERSSPQAPILPGMQGLVARAVMSTPEGRQRYRIRVSQLHTNVFNAERILKRVDELAAVIRPALAESFRAGLHYDFQIRRLKQRIEQRAESLASQIPGLAAPKAVPRNQAMRLTDWKPRVQAGAPNFREEQEQNRALLHISSVHGNTTGSWRTRLALEPGEYRFEGRIRTREVKPVSADAGAGLRVSGGKVRGLSGTADWRNFTCPFEVTEDGSEVEFVCELRASSGEAWFDATSLRVVPAAQR